MHRLKVGVGVLEHSVGCWGSHRKMTAVTRIFSTCQYGEEQQHIRIYRQSGLYPTVPITSISHCRQDFETDFPFWRFLTFLGSGFCLYAIAEDAVLTAVGNVLRLQAL